MGLSFDSLPRDDNGRIVGAYRVHVPGVALEHHGGPIEGLELERLHAAFGSELVVESGEEQSPPPPAASSEPAADTARRRRGR